MFHIFINKEMGSWDWSMTCSHTRQGAESFSAGLKREFPRRAERLPLHEPHEKGGRVCGSRHKAQPRQAVENPAGSSTYPFSECLSAHLLTGRVLSTGDIAVTKKAKGKTLISRNLLFYNCPPVFVGCQAPF